MAALSATIAMSGGADYASLSAAEAGERAAHINLDGDGNQIELIIQESGADSNQVSFGAWVTSAVNYITVTVSTTYRHAGTRGTGYRVTLTGGWQAGLGAIPDYTVVNGVAVNGGSFAGTSGFVVPDKTGIKILNCLSYDTDDPQFYFYSFLGKSYCINCTALGGGSTGFYVRNSGTLYSYFCTSLHNTNFGFYVDDFNTHIVKNCYAGGNGIDYENNAGLGTLTITTSNSADGSEGTTVTSLANCHFTNSTDGSEDIHTDSSSSLYHAGTDLSADVIYPVTTDFEGTARSATPCIGSDEYVISSWSDTIEGTLTLSSNNSYIITYNFIDEVSGSLTLSGETVETAIYTFLDSMLGTFTLSGSLEPYAYPALETIELDSLICQSYNDWSYEQAMSFSEDSLIAQSVLDNSYITRTESLEATI